MFRLEHLKMGFAFDSLFLLNPLSGIPKASRNDNEKV
jgi:hypothetical protein